ncbi:MAG TPA: endonuclease/exonuclease/phosphatase family protein [Aggregatilineaceae bacterium]|nr:endonuclease/exonuclease/phosphatase family protein [Aggregatilineaceae bacterium]
MPWEYTAPAATIWAGAFCPLLSAAWTLIQAGILLYGLALSGYLLARLAVGGRWRWVALADNFVPWWTLGGLAAAGIALFSRQRWLLILPQLPILITFLVRYGAMLLPRTTRAPAGRSRVLAVTTYNIKAWTSNPQRVVDAIVGLDADVIGLEEVGPLHADLLRQALSEEYPYQALYPELPFHGVALLSRHPIAEEAVIRPFPDSMLYLRAVVEVESTPVTIYVVHPPPPWMSASPLTYDSKQRDTEIALLRDKYLCHETGPLIVLGDFNMSDRSDAYRALDHRLIDSFREAGRGLGLTFPAAAFLNFPWWPRLLRIDYVWHNAFFVAIEARAGKDSGTSDHRPVTARLAWKEDSHPS